jgi:hypothetical protein
MAGKYEGYGRPDGDICYTSADPFATFLMTAQPAATPLTRLCPPEPFTSHWEVMVYRMNSPSDNGDSCAAREPYWSSGPIAVTRA